MNTRMAGLGSLLILGLLLPTLTSSTSNGGTPKDSFSIEGNAGRGRRVFVRSGCVDCHSVMGSGGELGPDLAVVGKDRSYHRLVAKLWDHLPIVSAHLESSDAEWPTLSDEGMTDLLAYLFQLGFFEEAGDYAVGKRLFQMKGCSRCHSIGDEGGSVGPPLDRFASHASPLRMVSAMWSHGPLMIKQLRAMGVDVPTFAKNEIADVLAYLRGSTLHPGPRGDLLTPGNASRGLNVFIGKQCTLCHPIPGQEQTATGPDLAAVTERRDVSEYAGILWNHGPMVWDAMLEEGIAIPPFSAEEMADLVAYIFFLDFYRSQGDAERGASLFVERGCVTCHAQEAVEDSESPSLDDILEYSDPTSLPTAIWNHGLDWKSDANFPHFSEDEMRDLTAYFAELAGSGTD